MASPSSLEAESVRLQIAPLIDSNRSIRVEWPRQPIDPEVLIILSNHYYVHLGMEALQLNFDRDAAKLVISEFDDLTAKRMVSSSFEAGYSNVWRNQLTETLIQKFRDNLLSLVNGKNTRFIEIHGKMAGIILVDAFASYRNERENHLGWIWIEASLSKSTRQSIAASLLRQASEIAPGKILAGVYIRNLSSYYFLKRAGFEPVCAHISQA